MKRFYLRRIVDISGVSGVGNVLEGCQFDDGHVAIIWLSDKHVMSFYDNVDTVVEIHGHEGSTQLIWIDDESSNICVDKQKCFCPKQAV